MKIATYDVVIIGAGPAGPKSAEVLAENKKGVLVLEKNKIIGKKTCVGGLTRKFLETDFPIEEVGGRFFNDITYHSNKKKHLISAEKPLIVITEREELGEYMAKKAIEKGAEIKKETEIKGIGKNFVVTSRNEKIFFNYLIGADGSNSLVRKFLKIPSKKFLFSLVYNVPRYYKNLEIFFDSKIFGDGYGDIFPHKEYTQIGITVDSNFCSMKEAKRILDKWIKTKKFNVEGGEFMAGIINYDYRGFRFGNKFLVGDAAGFANGFTGEGIFLCYFIWKRSCKENY